MMMDVQLTSFSLSGCLLFNADEKRLDHSRESFFLSVFFLRSLSLPHVVADGLDDDRDQINSFDE